MSAFRTLVTTSFWLTGQVLDQALFHHEPEGMGIYDCGEGTGFWVATDQAPTTSYFHVLDRADFRKLGTFVGAVTANTDGIAVTSQASQVFASGAFYAVHDDQSVTGFDWATIAAALDLPTCSG